MGKCVEKVVLEVQKLVILMRWVSIPELSDGCKLLPKRATMP